VRAYGTYFSLGTPGPDLVAPADPTTVPNQNRVGYDGAGRAVLSVFQPYGAERWRTSTTYGGDHTDVTPPAGGTATSTVVDGRGRTVELRRYHGGTPAGPFDATTYGYNNKNLLARVTDAAGNRWEYGYDVRGRQIRFDDPDKGRTTSTYDDAGQVTSSTDARGVTLAYAYDELGRRTGVFTGSLTGTRLAGWTYDTTKLPNGVTPAKGQPSSSTRHVGSDAYTVATTGYTESYQPTGTAVTIPAAEAGLAGTYQFRTTYNPDGSPATRTYPATGDLSAEAVTVGYTDLGLPRILTTVYGAGPESSYVSDTRYNAIAQPDQYTLHTGLFGGTGGRVYRSYTRELETGRLTRITTQRDAVSPNTLSDLHYSHDPVGKVTKVADNPAGGVADVQCFGYDQQQRLTEAWTPASGDCAAARTSAGLGGAAPYWQSWTYDPIGRRRSQVDHGIGGSGDATTTYAYAPGTSQPHTLTGTTRTVGGVSTSAGYRYDATGNTTSRPAPGGNQTLDWDVEGEVGSTTDPAGTTSYLYDADGNRLIRRDPGGKTLYLPDSELRWNAVTNARTCVRFYDFDGGTVAQRTAGAVTWLAPDHHGTQQVAIDAATQAATQRRETPFGLTRGTAVSWPSEKGFVGGTMDPTGLTHLGAREYDPAIGRFASVDPLVDYADPEQMNGYAYANNSPVTFSDPDGLCIRLDDRSGPCIGSAAVANYAGAPNIINSNAGGGTHQGGGGHSGGGGNGGGSHGKQKKCSTWDVGCKAKKAVAATANWVDDHRELLATVYSIGAGVGLGLACGAAIGWTGVGAVACGAVVGAVVAAADYAIRNVGKDSFSLGGLVKHAAVGGLVGGALGGLGAVAGGAVRAGAAANAARKGAAEVLLAGAKGAARTAKELGKEAVQAAATGGRAAGRAAGRVFGKAGSGAGHGGGSSPFHPRSAGYQPRHSGVEPRGSGASTGSGPGSVVVHRGSPQLIQQYLPVLEEAGAHGPEPFIVGRVVRGSHEAAGHE
jgi:RHS repeat-associated protein